MNRKLKYILLLIIIGFTGPIGMILFAVALHQDIKADKESTK